MLDTESSILGSISLLTILIGAGLLYFGRIISDVKVEKYDKMMYYINGLLFVATHVFLPLILVYALKELIDFQIPIFLIFLIQIIILIPLRYNLIANEYLRRHGLFDLWKRKLIKELNEMKKKKSIFGKLIKKISISDGVKANIFIWYKLPIEFIGNFIVLFIFSFISILLSYDLYLREEMILFFISLLLTFFILTLIAIAYGFRNTYYPNATIHLKNNKIMQGKILKYSEYVCLLKKNKIINIKEDSIDYIEQDKFKK